MDREAWWATAHRVAKNRTQLKRVSMHACKGGHRATALHVDSLV